MNIQKNAKIDRLMDQIALERSRSDEDTSRILHLLNYGTPVVQFQNCETFEAPPFDRCKNDSEKRKMMASILTMGDARKIQKFNAYNIADNIQPVMDLNENMEEFSPDILSQDPYLSHISLPMFYDDSFSFSFHTYQKDRLFHFDSPVEKGYRDIIKLGYFLENVNYPYIARNGDYFAEISVHEIISSKKLISPLSGNVLITGLQIGYLPYLAHLKDSVETVTIVEEDEKVISLFNKEILPQFNYPDKIRIIRQDIDTFLQEWDKEYDCLILNHYEDSLVGVKEYLKAKKIETLHKNTKFLYKIEDSVLTNIKTGVFWMCIAEMSDQMQLYDTLGAEEATASVLHILKPVFSSYTIRSVRDLEKLFQNKELKKIVRKNVNNI